MVSLGDSEPTKGLDVGVMGVGFVALRLPASSNTAAPHPHPQSF